MDNFFIFYFVAAFSPGLNASMVPYTVSKHGVVAMTRTLATDNSSGIMHKVICPAYVDTEIVSTATTDPIRLVYCQALSLSTLFL